MNRSLVIGGAVVVALVLIGGYWMWSKDADRENMQAPLGEEAANGEVIDSSQSVPETADLEAELNASGADTDEDMEKLEAEFETAS